MATDKQIRIIKRAERHGPPTVSAEENEAAVDNARVPAGRDAMTIVNGWVREFRHKKVEEAARRFESLFREAA